MICLLINFLRIKNKKTFLSKYFCYVNVSKANISLACEFLATVLRILSRTFAQQVSHECRENFHVSRICRELVVKDLNMFKNFMRIFWPKYFARLSRDVRASVPNLSPRNFGKFTMRNFCDTRTNVCQCRTTVVRMSCQCRATVVQIRMKMSYIRGKVVRHMNDA